MNSSKPDTRTAMYRLIETVRGAIPFDTPESTLCSDHCRICNKKLLEFLASELEGWEYRLTQNEIPSFADLSKMEKTARKVHGALTKSGFLTEVRGRYPSVRGRYP